MSKHCNCQWKYLGPIVYSVGKMSLTARTDIWFHLLWPSINICQIITEILTHAQQWAHLLTQELFPSDCPMIQPPLREYSRPGPENPAELEREREFFILFLGQGTQAKYKHTDNSINITKPDKVTHSYKEAKMSLVFDLYRVQPYRAKPFQIPPGSPLTDNIGKYIKPSSHRPSHLPHSAPLPLPS